MKEFLIRTKVITETIFIVRIKADNESEALNKLKSNEDYLDEIYDESGLSVIDCEKEVKSVEIIDIEGVNQ